MYFRIIDRFLAILLLLLSLFCRNFVSVKFQVLPKIYILSNGIFLESRYKIILNKKVIGTDGNTMKRFITSCFDILILKKYAENRQNKEPELT